MSKTVPTVFTPPTMANSAEGEVIQFVDFREILRAQNYLFRRAGMRVLGTQFDPLFQTTSTTITKTNSSTGTNPQNADGIWGRCTVLKLVQSGVNTRYTLYFQAMLKNCEAVFNVFDDTLGLADTITLSNATSSWLLKTQQLEVDPVDGTDYTIELDGFNVPTSGTAYAAQVLVHESLATASQLPTGR